MLPAAESLVTVDPSAENHLWHIVVDENLPVLYNQVRCTLITMKNDFWQWLPWKLWYILQKSLLMITHMFTVKIMELLHTHRHTNPQKDIGEIRFIDILYMNHWDAMINYMMVKTTFRNIHIYFILIKWILYCIVLIFLLIWKKF